MIKTTFLLLLLMHFAFVVDAQTTVNLNPIKDNTILSDRTSNSSGGGKNFVGRIRGEGLRRALIQFDLSNIPNGSIITEVSLNVNVDMTGRTHTNSIVYNLHRLNKDWGEGTSVGSRGGGGGATAVAPDATWINAITGITGSTWTTQGGDFENNPTASSTFTGMNGTQTFNTSTALVNEVQNWLDGNTSNFGWIIIGGESISESAIRIGSKEMGTAPVLNITYTTEILNIENSIPSISNILLYPNPTNGELYFNSLEALNVTAKVYSSLGKLVSTQKITTNFSLKINEPSGIYFVELVNSSGFKKTFKVIKR